ncbi:MAG: AraC family transcriptional regulator [Psychrobium sp.]|nr:AraC family transcriptional regulator [Psychrobium sp.]
MQQKYQQRFDVVFAYIELHIDDDISLDVLADVACFSKFHFQRQFSAAFGMSANRYISRLRFKRSAYQLAFNPQLSISDIAGEMYQDQSAFSRAFKKTYGQTPLQFRQETDWQQWSNYHSTPTNMGSSMNKNYYKSYQLSQISIINFPATKIAVLEHRGSPQLVMATVQKFIAWRKENKLPPSKYATFNVLYDDPNNTSADDYRFDVCCAIDSPVAENKNDSGVIEKVLPSSRCAKLSYVGDDDGLRGAIDYLYGHWLAQSDETPSDNPLFIERITMFPMVSERQQQIDIFLPL